MIEVDSQLAQYKRTILFITRCACACAIYICNWHTRLTGKVWYNLAQIWLELPQIKIRNPNLTRKTL